MSTGEMSAACMFAPPGVSVDALPRQGTEAHVSSGFAASEAVVEGCSPDSSSGRPGSAYFIGQKSHSRRFWLLLYCHDN